MHPFTVRRLPASTRITQRAASLCHLYGAVLDVVNVGGILAGFIVQTELLCAACSIRPRRSKPRRTAVRRAPLYVGSVSAGTGTEEYYHHWAPEYDQVYTRPERQSDMLVVRARLTDWF